MTNHHISVRKADLILAMDDLRLSGRDYSADLLKKALFAVPVSTRHDDKMCREAYDDFYHKIRAEIGYDHWCAIWRFIFKQKTAQEQPTCPVCKDTGIARILWTKGECKNCDAAQAQQPVSSAELHYDEKIEQLRARHAATLANIQAFVACDASAISYLTLGEYRSALLKILNEAKANE